MTKTRRLSGKPGKVITIIGSGFTGSSLPSSRRNLRRTPRQWEVETFRSDNAETAKLSIETTLGFHTPQQQRKKYVWKS